VENPAMADQNLRSLVAGGPLTAEEKEKILEIRRQLGQRYCRRCDYCQPCPQNIDIATIFLFHGYYTRYDMKEWALKRYDGLKVKGDACVRCGQCASRCPYGLPIPEMIANAVADMRVKS
jgi:predicted aldo/keto reductase-like oxidoreductase